MNFAFPCRGKHTFAAVFDFNFYSSLLLIGFVQGLVYACLLLLRGLRQDRISDFFAASILLVGALYVAPWMLGFAGWYDAHDWRTTLMFYGSWNNLSLLGPLVPERDINDVMSSLPVTGLGINCVHLACMRCGVVE